MKILVTEPIHSQGISHLEGTGEVIMGTGTDEETIIREGKDADAILVRVAKITERIVEALPRLKVVAKHGIGVDNIDVACCTRRGVMVVNAPRSNANAVAEHTAALILAAAKNLVFLDGRTREGGFSDRNSWPTVELEGKTVGFIGMGNIAALAAKKLSGFDMKVIAYDPYKTESDEAELVKTPEEVYARADVISLHIPLTPETRHMISDQAFSMMKSGAIIVNASRGGTIDEKALYRALREKKIRGAAFDVFEEEPPTPDNPLFALNNVTVSPHNAALSEQALINMAVHAARGICDRLEGRTPEWVVNRELL